MWQNIKRRMEMVGKEIIGALLILIGAIGLFLPLIPGILLIVAGLLMVGGAKMKMHLLKILARLRIWWRRPKV